MVLSYLLTIISRCPSGHPPTFCFPSQSKSAISQNQNQHPHSPSSTYVTSDNDVNRPRTLHPPQKSSSPPMREEMGDASSGSGSRGSKNHLNHSHYSLASQATDGIHPSTDPCNSSEGGRYRGQTLPSIPSFFFWNNIICCLFNRAHLSRSYP